MKTMWRSAMNVPPYSFAVNGKEINGEELL